MDTKKRAFKFNKAVGGGRDEKKWTQKTWLPSGQAWKTRGDSAIAVAFIYL